MKVILPVAPTSNSESLVTTGATSTLNFLQHSPRGIGLPWGQVGGCPRKVQTLSVSSLFAQNMFHPTGVVKDLIVRHLEDICEETFCKALPPDQSPGSSMTLLGK